MKLTWKQRFKMLALGEVPPEILAQQTGRQPGSRGGKGGPNPDRIPSARLRTYEEMMRNPTIAMVRAVANAPVRLSKWSIEADDDVPSDRPAFIQSELKAIWCKFIKETVMSRDFGFSPFEQVFGLRPNGLIGIDKMKPLSRFHTKPLIDKETGSIVGLQNKTIKLPDSKMFWFIHDGDERTPFGRSLHENIRIDAWWPWKELSKKQANYAAQAAGVIPMVFFPEGESLDKDGSKEDNFVIAKRIIAKLGKNEGVVMPKVFDRVFDGAEVRALPGLKLEDMLAWSIKFLETSQQHGQEFIDMMQHREKLMARGWLVPERAVQEGLHGTKAEAGVHGDIVLVVALLFFLEIMEEVNHQVIDNLAMVNWGPDMKGKIRMVQGGLDPVAMAMLQDIMKAVLTEPANIDIFLSSINLDTALDLVGLPKDQEVVKIVDRKVGEEEDVPTVEGALSLLYSAVKNKDLVEAS